VSDSINGTYSSVAGVELLGEADNYSIALSGDYVYSVNPDAKFIRIRITKFGVPTSDVTLGAYLAP